MGKYIGRSMFTPLIDGLKPGRVDYVKMNYKVLQPGTNYTFFREFTAPERNQYIAYCTPPPGQYTAKVWVAGQSIQDSQSSFSIVNK